MKMAVSEIAKAINADETYLNEEQLAVEVTGTNFDSRNIEAGDLFVPLQGAHDGHDYIASAIANGAHATLWSKERVDFRPQDLPVLVVDDPLTAYQQLSQYYLTKINPRVVAVTGSNGKTTTKDMIAAILSQDFNVTKTYDNFNNEIGVPYTILQMEANTEFLVIELGMDRPGQLDFLSKLVQPDVAVITMIGEAHIEFFGTRDKIADAKMEITHGLKEDGFFVYNGDEPLLRERATTVEMEQRTFGRQVEDDLYATEVVDGRFETDFKVNDDPTIEFKIPLIGDYNVDNALAAIEVGHIFQIPDRVTQGALEHFAITKNRTEWLSGNKGEAILSDVYNSNPTAAKEVLAAFSKTQTEGRHIAVLGDMLELGAQSAKMHADLADDLDPKQIETVYLIGTDMAALRDRLLTKYAPANVHYYTADQLAQLSADLQADITANDEVMLKASHGLHLEKVVADLTK
ncbi:UDP-N-acetylmuramoyl-tripeptide--D-alanyl-D-alanine ligase [Lentilactobacillus senioris]|uniref:UDP-N-acetylmuramoyl-tripeptide--D-alanyl-D- alanine ligase n=1 Tax=Lentilactobacillus senioris TaxID=931534 RepID=UPI0022826982|nr:UDP-N-acetylmuramoyl-tripeptide--D-alanyl-D-alanine ligase [Lentilactobacillus senioris]MCY9807565.1 UDP-N-acetylmuramoyl-tripeptide--D-alanyl-D-alanine ligase [Lentilactobacillus senioris]